MAVQVAGKCRVLDGVEACRTQLQQLAVNPGHCAHCGVLRTLHSPQQGSAAVLQCHTLRSRCSCLTPVFLRLCSCRSGPEHASRWFGQPPPEQQRRPADPLPCQGLPPATADDVHQRECQQVWSCQNSKNCAKGCCQFTLQQVLPYSPTPAPHAVHACASARVSAGVAGLTDHRPGHVRRHACWPCCPT